MNHQTSLQDIIQSSSSLAEESYLQGSTFILQHSTGAMEQSSEAEFYEMVSKRFVLHEQKPQLVFKVAFPFFADN